MRSGLKGELDMLRLRQSRQNLDETLNKIRSDQ